MSLSSKFGMAYKTHFSHGWKRNWIRWRKSSRSLRGWSNLRNFRNTWARICGKGSGASGMIGWPSWRRSWLRRVTIFRLRKCWLPTCTVARICDGCAGGESKGGYSVGIHVFSGVWGILSRWSGAEDSRVDGQEFCNWLYITKNLKR